MSEASPSREAVTKPAQKTSADYLAQTPYLKGTRDQAEQTVPRMIRAFLGDTTLPLSVKLLYQEKHETNLSKMKFRTAEERNKRIAFFTEDEFSALCTSSHMIRFRQRAADISARYEAAAQKGYASVDSHFMKEAARLHEQMWRFANEFSGYRFKRITVDTLAEGNQTILTKLNQKITTALEVAKDRAEEEGEASRYTTINISLPVEDKGDYGWGDREKISLTFDTQEEKGRHARFTRWLLPPKSTKKTQSHNAPHPKITSVVFQEFFDGASFCSNIDQLVTAYQAGRPLTDSQRQLLIDSGKGDTISELHNPIRVTGTDKTRIWTTPLLVFPYTLPQDLAQKLKGKSTKDFYSQGGLNEVGPFQVNFHPHDYGGDMFTIALDTTKLTNDEVYRLVGHYIDAARAFPRVRKVKQT